MLDETSVLDRHQCYMVAKFGVFVVDDHSKVSKGVKIRNRYNQVPHLTQNTNEKVTNSQ